MNNNYMLLISMSIFQHFMLQKCLQFYVLFNHDYFLILLGKKLDFDIGELFDVLHKNKHYHDVPCSALRQHSVHIIYIYATYTTILDNDFTMYAMFRILLSNFFTYFTIQQHIKRQTDGHTSIARYRNRNPLGAIITRGAKHGSGRVGGAKSPRGTNSRIHRVSRAIIFSRASRIFNGSNRTKEFSWTAETVGQ